MAMLDEAGWVMLTSPALPKVGSRLPVCVYRITCELPVRSAPTAMTSLSGCTATPSTPAWLDGSSITPLEPTVLSSEPSALYWMSSTPSASDPPRLTKALPVTSVLSPGSANALVKFPEESPGEVTDVVTVPGGLPAGPKDGSRFPANWSATQTDGR